MTCDERRDFLLLYAAGGLEPAERDEMRAHLSTGCAQCAASLAEAEATVSHLPLALDLHAPSAAVKQRLMAKVRGDSRATATARPAQRRSWVSYAIAAAIGALLTAAVFQYAYVARQRERMESLQVALADRETTIEELRGMLGAGQLQLIAFQGKEPQPKAAGRIFWDRDKNDWHMFVFDMSPPPAGKEYELWFITADERKVRAGMFNVDAKGRAYLNVAVPEGLGPLAAAAVTDEPLGGVDQPTGSIQLVGPVEKE